MSLVESAWIECPYCGENIELVIDCSIESQQYIEDCFVCCKPISLSIDVESNGKINVVPRHENDI